MSDLMPLDLNYQDRDVDLGIDALVGRGQRVVRRRRARIASCVGATVGMAVSLAVLVPALESGSHRDSTVTTQTSTPATDNNDLVQAAVSSYPHPPRSDVETLLVTSNGWQNIAWVDANGDLCAASVPPHAQLAHREPLEPTSSCSYDMPFTGSLDVMEIQPEAEVVNGELRAGHPATVTFGIVRDPDIAAINLDDPAAPVDAVISTVHTADGSRIWMAEQPSGSADDADTTIVGRSASGAVVARTLEHPTAQ